MPYIIKNINGKPHIVEYTRKASPPLLSKAFEEQFDSQHGPGAYKEHMRQLLKNNPKRASRGKKRRKVASEEALAAGMLHLYAKEKKISVKTALDRLIAFEQHMDDKDA